MNWNVAIVSLVLIASESSAVDLNQGKSLYLKHCAQCHGDNGTPYQLDPSKAGEYRRHPKTEVPLIDEAAAPAAPIAHPRPRDLTIGVYKLRSTPSGELPTDADIARSIARGMPGTAMPAWSPLLSEAQIADVAAYIKTFSKRFDEEKPSRRLDPKRLEKTADSLKNGEAAYLNLACFMCHGVEGRGDGDVGLYRRDRADQGNKVSAANFHRRWTLRGGPTVDDIYRGFMTGFTLMPSYEESFPATAEGRRQAWDLAYYLDSMSRESPSPSHFVQARSVEALPGGIDDPAWAGAPLVDIFLAGQIFREPRYWEASITMVSMRALSSGGKVAILLEWDDPRRNLSPVPDAIELQFAVHPEAAGHFFLGGKPVEEWKWSAGANSATRRNTLGPVVPVKARDLPKPTAVSEYKAGRWRVLLNAPLKLDTPRLFSISAWDGDPEEREEKGLKRALSGWHYLVASDRVSEVAKLDHLVEDPEAAPASFSWRRRKVQTASLKNPFNDDPAKKAEASRAGKALYAKKCLACHGDRLDGEGHFSPAFYPRPESLLEEIPHHDESYIFWRIGRGGRDLNAADAARSAMPAWETELSDEQIWQLVTYLVDAALPAAKP